MKSYIVCLLGCLLVLTIVVQGNAQIHFSLGLKTGINLSTISFDPDPYQNAQGITKGGSLRLVVGAVAELAFANMFAVQLEPGYNSNATDWSNAQNAKETFSVSKLQIPILFKVKFLQGMVRPYGFLGPNLGIVLSAKDKVEGTGTAADRETDVKSNVSGLDFALDFGGGAEFKLANNVSLTGDVRYSLGLSNLSSPQQLPNVPQQNTQSIKSRGLEILFGVLFHV